MRCGEMPSEVSLADLGGSRWELSATKAFWMKEERSGDSSNSTVEEVQWHN